VAGATATDEFDGFATRMKTAVPDTLPDAAVTAPDTVKVPEPTTEDGATDTVTESLAAAAFSGTISNEDSKRIAIATFLALLPIVR